MRYDMGRVVIEKERRGSRNLGRKVHTFGKIVDGEYYGPTKIPISRHRQFGYESKEPTDVLSPLNGYLKKQVGRAWDDVWSELCQNLRKGGIGVSHILEAHVDVYHKCWWGEGTGPYNQGKIGFYGARIGSRIGCWPVGDGDLYVDPETGLLAQWGEHKRPSWKQHQPLSLDRMYARDGMWYVRIKGLWFLGTYSKGAIRFRGKGDQITMEYEWPDFYGWRFNVVKSCSKKDLKDIRRKLYLLRS